MNHEELETLDPLKPETYVRIRRCRETAEVDFLTQVDDSLVPPFHEDETLMMKRHDHIQVFPENRGAVFSGIHFDKHIP